MYVAPGIVSGGVACDADGPRSSAIPMCAQKKIWEDVVNANDNMRQESVEFASRIFASRI